MLRRLDSSNYSRRPDCDEQAQFNGREDQQSSNFTPSLPTLREPWSHADCGVEGPRKSQGCDQYYIIDHDPDTADE
jgi:hypothetical protein